MIGILVVTHGSFGRELIKSTEVIIGHQENTYALGLNEGDGIDEFKEKVAEEIKKLDGGDGVLVFADLFGGSPFNVTAINISNNEKGMGFECVTGVNSPMLIDAFTMRNSLKIAELKNQCMESGKLGIKDMRSEI